MSSCFIVVIDEDSPVYFEQDELPKALEIFMHAVQNNDEAELRWSA